jgi:hypothetical protein
MIGMHRRQSVMGNGRELSGKGLSGTGLSERSLSERRLSGSSLQWVRVSGAALVLLLAACVILGSGSRRYSPRASAQLPASPLSAVLGHSASQSKPDAHALLGQLPLIFEPNQGQAQSGVKFVSRGQGYSLFLDDSGAVLALQAAKPQSVRMTLVGANRTPQVAGSRPLPGASNYFIGNDPKKWRTGIPHFAGVHYQSVYPGIDLVFYGHQGRLEYDFKVAPGADPSQAELQFDGASKLELSGGDLILTGSGADVRTDVRTGVRLQAPHIYQRVADREQPVEGRFVLRAANRVGFEIGPYDRNRELVIDPTISYSTYFGGNNTAGTATTSDPFIAVNGNGFIYLTGSTTATNLLTEYPVASPIQGTLNGTQNIFILELDPTAAAFGAVYLTYLGGSGIDSAAGIAVDSGGNAYVAGTTTSPNFPTANGYQGTPEAGSTGTSHVFVSKISQLTSTTPALSYSTYLSGNGTDVASGMTIDSNADVFVTGSTTSTDVPSTLDVFPATYLPKPYQPSPSSGSTIQFFVTEVNTSLIGLPSIAYSTYFGGATPSGAIALGGAIAVDTVGNVYFSGTTNFYNSGEGTSGTGGLQSTDFPILNAYQPCLDSPPPTTVLPPVACTAPGSTPYPTDAFLAKLNPANATTGAAQLLFSTYLGGTQADSATGITLDTGAADIYLTGTTNSSDFVVPTGIAPFQDCLNTPVNPVNGTAGCTVATSTSPTDAYVAKFTNQTEATGTTPTAVSLSYFSYLGGTGNDSGLAIAVDTAEGALLTGATSSPDFPVSVGAIQPGLNGTQNAFFAHINTTTVTGTNTVANYATYFGGNGIDRGTSITVDPSLNTYFAGDTTSATGTFQLQAPLQAQLLGSQDAFAVKLQPNSTVCIKCILPTLSPLSGVVGAGNPITITFTVINEGPDLATNVIVSGQLTAGAATFNPASSSAGTCAAPSGDNPVACTIPVLQSGSTATVVFSVTPTTAGAGSVTATVTSSNNINQSNTVTASFTATNFSLTVTPSSQTVVAGGVVTYYVQVSPSLTFGNNVSLSCTGLPVGASCGFTPATLIFTGPGSLSSTLNLTTTARPITTISSIKSHGPVYAFWLMAPGMALIGFGKNKLGKNKLGKNKSRRSRVLSWLALTILFAFFALQPACSSKKQIPIVTGTPAGTYPLTVTATSGTFTQSIGFNLTVQ